MKKSLINAALVLLLASSVALTGCGSVGGIVVDSLGAYAQWTQEGHDGTYVAYVKWVLSNGGEHSRFGAEVYAQSSAQPLMALTAVSAGPSGGVAPCPESPFTKSDITGISYEHHTPNPSSLLNPLSWEGMEAPAWYDNTLRCLSLDPYFRAAVSGPEENRAFHPQGQAKAWDMAEITSIHDPIGTAKPYRIREPVIGKMTRLLSDEPACEPGYRWMPRWCQAARDVDELMASAFAYPVGSPPKTALGWSAARHDWLDPECEHGNRVEHIRLETYWLAQCAIVEAHCSADLSSVGSSIVTELRSK